MQKSRGLVAIVENDSAMRKSIERLLRVSGYATSAFESAEDFLQNAVVEDAIGLILDIQLGGLSGIELQRRLAAAGSSIPVVFITAHDSEAMRREALAVGCVDYLRKPFEANRLIESLERGRKREGKSTDSSNCSCAGPVVLQRRKKS